MDGVQNVSQSELDRRLSGIKLESPLLRDRRSSKADQKSLDRQPKSKLVKTQVDSLCANHDAMRLTIPTLE